MFGGWFGGSGPQAGEPVTYPECETPTSDAELRALIEKKFEQFLTLTRASGWNNIPVTEEGMTDLELSDIKQEGSTVDTVRVVGTMSVNTDKLATLLMTQDLEVYKNWDPDCLEIRPVKSMTLAESAAFCLCCCFVFVSALHVQQAGVSRSTIHFFVIHSRPLQVVSSGQFCAFRYCLSFSLGLRAFLTGIIFTRGRRYSHGELRSLRCSVPPDGALLRPGQGHQSMHMIAAGHNC
jgi:hypothetical protein